VHFSRECRVKNIISRNTTTRCTASSNTFIHGHHGFYPAHIMTNVHIISANPQNSVLLPHTYDSVQSFAIIIVANHGTAGISLKNSRYMLFFYFRISYSIPPMDNLHQVKLYFPAFSSSTASKCTLSCPLFHECCKPTDQQSFFARNLKAASALYANFK